MKYENAKELLPEALLKEVQKYAGGKLLYIPVEYEQSKGLVRRPDTGKNF